MAFKFELKTRVKLVDSGEEGVVNARVEYTNRESGYLVRYKAASGCQTEAWWDEHSISNA